MVKSELIRFSFLAESFGCTQRRPENPVKQRANSGQYAFENRQTDNKSTKMPMLLSHHFFCLFKRDMSKKGQSTIDHGWMAGSSAKSEAAFEKKQ